MEEAVREDNHKLEEAAEGILAEEDILAGEDRRVVAEQDKADLQEVAEQDKADFEEVAACCRWSVSGASAAELEG